MKRITFITALMAMMMMAVTPAFAQEENGFKKLLAAGIHSMYIGEVINAWMK